MKTLRLSAAALAAACALLAGYLYGVKPLERLGLRAWHDFVVRNLVTDRAALNAPRFMLGLYRPELPYQFGMHWAIQRGLGVRVPIVSYYQAWGDGDEYAFKTDVNRNLHAGGHVPLITWEPWVAGFQRYKGRQVDSSLALIARGDFDPYIRSWARDAVRFGRPLFLRPGHEMSNAWYAWSVQHGNPPQQFRAFWRRVHGIFREEGAHNVAFVWNPYTPADTACYPGDEYVDWIGLDIFNFGPLSESGVWTDFYLVTKVLYDAVKGYGKPVILAEVGCVSAGGNKNDWYRTMFHSLALGDFPLVKALVLFDTPHATTPTGLPVDLSFSSDDSVYAYIRLNELTDSIGMQPIAKGATP